MCRNYLHGESLGEGFVVFDVRRAMHEAAAGGRKLSRVIVLGESRDKVTLAEIPKNENPIVRDSGAIVFAQDNKGVASM